MLLPGPEAQQLAVYTGWLLNGWARRTDRRRPVRAARRASRMLALSWLYVAHGDTDARHRAVPRARAGGGGDRRAGGAPGREARPRPRGAGRPRGRGVPRARAARTCRSRWWCWAPGIARLGCSAAGGPRRPPRREPADDGGPPPLVPDDALHRAPPSARRNLRSSVVGLVLWVAPVVLACASPAGTRRSSPTRASSSAAWRW